MKKITATILVSLAAVMMVFAIGAPPVVYNDSDGKVQKGVHGQVIKHPQGNTQTDATSISTVPTSVTTTPYPVVAGDYILDVNTSSAKTINLLTAAAANGITASSVLIIKDVTGSAATNNITIHPASGDKIDNSTSDLVINVNLQSVRIYSIGGSPGNWYTLRDTVNTSTSGTINTGAANALAAYSGAGTTIDDVANADSVSGPNTCGADSGSANAYVCALPITPGAYGNGTHYFFKAANANTGASTINISGLGIKTIKKFTSASPGADLIANDIRAGQWVELMYDGTNMQDISLLGNAATGGSGPIVTTYSSFSGSTSTSGAISLTGGKTTLKIYVVGRSASSTANEMFVRFNADSTSGHYLTAGYYNQFLSSSTHTEWDSESMTTANAARIGWMSVSAQPQSCIMATVPNYTSTVNKAYNSIFSFTSSTPHGANGQAYGSWTSTSAITSVEVFDGASTNIGSSTVVTLVEE